VLIYCGSRPPQELRTPLRRREIYADAAENTAPLSYAADTAEMPAWQPLYYCLRRQLTPHYADAEPRWLDVITVTAFSFAATIQRYDTLRRHITPSAATYATPERYHCHTYAAATLSRIRHYASLSQTLIPRRQRAPPIRRIPANRMILLKLRHAYYDDITSFIDIRCHAVHNILYYFACLHERHISPTPATTCLLRRDAFMLILIATPPMLRAAAADFLFIPLRRDADYALRRYDDALRYAGFS